MAWCQTGDKPVSTNDVWTARGQLARVRRAPVRNAEQVVASNTLFISSIYFIKLNTQLQKTMWKSKISNSAFILHKSISATSCELKIISVFSKLENLIPYQGPHYIYTHFL